MRRLLYPRHPRPSLIRSIGFAVLAVTAVASQTKAAEPDRTIRFNRDIRPILSDKCFRCHGPDASTREADLRFDLEEDAKDPRGGHPAIAPHQPEASELVSRITSEDPDLRMPPPDSGKELSEAEIVLLKRWIAAGAAYEAHWSFLPPRKTAIPLVQANDWPAADRAGEIDRFLLASWESEGLSPSPDADRVTLIRRLSFDLIGLPPSRADIDAFVNDRSDDAYERLVDRLLDSLHFGERLAMYWLDLVRYADTVGYHGDQEHAITPYRDWVIKAFNDNMRFDQFTLEQLAGDLQPDATSDQRIASGYNRLLQTSHEGGVQVKEYLSKYDADRARNVSAVWMGATLGCAQCHDHKYDPYTQRDFYSLIAFFADVDDMRTFKGGDTTPTKREPEIVTLSPIDRQQIAQMEAEAARLDELTAKQAARSEQASATAGDLTAQEQLGELRERIELRRQQTRRTMVTQSVAPRTIRMLNRGDWMDESGEIVSPAVPGFLPPMETAERPTRADLARWLTQPDHPQTARVFVNRLWYLYFGNGLSRSLEDSGSQGEWPTHPELLDYLAVEFAESGWNIKHMVKLLVTTRAYRQSSVETAELRERDPANRLFARQSRFRLPAELIRDNALAVSGLLVDRLGGPNAHPYQPAGYYKPLNFPTREYRADTDDQQYRRGVYTHWQRQFLHPMLRAFDAPSREECTAQRPLSNTPLAALALLNDPTFVEAARVFATRMLREAEGTEARVRWAWHEALSREPGEKEVSALVEFAEFNRTHYRAEPQAATELLKVGLTPIPKELDAVELAAWTNVARAILNLNELITRN